MFWQKDKIILIHLIFIIGLSAQAQSNNEREGFYRRQVLEDMQMKSRNKKNAPPLERPPVQTEIEAEFSQPVNTEMYQVELNEPDEKQWGLGLQLENGYSSNIAQFEGAPSGSFYDISPKAFWSGQLSESLDFNLGGDIFYRGFHSEEIDELFRTMIINGSGEFIYTVSDGLFLGLGGKITQFDGRQIDFRTPTNNGRDFNLSANEYRVFLAREWESLFIEISAGQEFVRSKTTVLDEAGNQFFLDMDQSFGGLRIGKDFSERIHWEGSYNFRYRNFLDQRARLGNGAVDPNFSTANFLIEVEHQLMSSISVYDVLLEGGYEYTLDLQAGAVNRQSYFGTLIVPMKLWNSVVLRPEAGIRQTQYENFIGQIFTNLNATQKRQDLWGFYGAELIVDLGTIDPVVRVRRTMLESNYSIIEFEEDLVSAGIQASF